MQNMRITRSTLALAILMAGGTPVIANSPAAPAVSEEVAEVTAPANAKAKPPFVPAAFHAPSQVLAAGFQLVPLGPELVKIDFDAYMSSIEHLQKTFSRSTAWPHKGISDAEAMQDMQAEQARFQNRKSFAYSVLTPDGRRERGCVYISPSPIMGYDAVVRLWVTQAEHDAGFDAELFEWVKRWIKSDWPFQHVAFPGRTIDWKTWDKLTAANVPANAPTTATTAQ